MAGLSLAKGSSILKILASLFTSHPATYYIFTQPSFLCSLAFENKNPRAVLFSNLFNISNRKMNFLSFVLMFRKFYKSIHANKKLINTSNLL